MTKELLKQALDALERFAYHGRAMGWEKVALDIRAHLAAPALEPVAYRHLHEDGYEYYDAPTGSDCADCEPLYAAPAPAVPPGWKLVPVEPTDEMVEAARHTKRERLLRAVEIIRNGDDPDRTDKWMGQVSADEYRAMIAAAPSSPPPVALSDEMDAVAIRYAHKLALDLECVLMDCYQGKWWDGAMKTIGEYRSAMNAIHERESPTFMGEPVGIKQGGRQT